MFSPQHLGGLWSPTLNWGPGDPAAKRELLAARTAGASGIDNPALSVLE